MRKTHRSTWNLTLLPVLALALLASAALTPALAAGPDPDRYIVSFLDAGKGKAALRAAGASVLLDLPRHEAAAVRIPARALRGLERNPHIEFIEPDPARVPLSQTTPYGIPMVQADLVSDALAANRTVCVIDSGYNAAHEDLPSGVTASPDPGSGDPFNDVCGHGTHVAGTVVALANNTGVLGVLPNGNLNVHVVKVFGDDQPGDCGWAYSSSLVAALDRCLADGAADVVSMSLGGTLKSRTEERAFADAHNLGVLSVAAAGNDGNTRKSYPASYDSVVSVAAVDSAKVVASFSQQNDQVELAAPGVSVRSTVPMGTGTDESLTVGTDSFEAISMEGSPDGSGSGPLVDCGLGTSPCAGASGAVCLIERGDVTFADKVLNCQAGGGTAAVVFNNQPGLFSGTLGGTATAIQSVAVSGDDGQALLGRLNDSATVTTQAGGNYAYFDGTSMATPHVSAVAALVWSHHDTCSNDDLRDALTSTAEDLGVAGRDVAYGFGLVQAQAAKDYLDVNGCGGSGGGCTLGQPGDVCSADSDCCSGTCKGKPGNKTCK